jgi:RNA polymerase sigma-70 factor, ECF subfamily
MENMGSQGDEVDRAEAIRQVGAAQSAQTALEEALAEHRGRLRRMVALRLDRRLQGRIDPSDVVQEAYLEAARRLPDYVREPDPMPMFLWLRFLAVEALLVLHRKHLGVMARDAGREVSINVGRIPRPPRPRWHPLLRFTGTKLMIMAIQVQEKRLSRRQGDRDEPDHS